MKKVITSLLIAFSAISFAQVGVSPNVNFTPNQTPFNARNSDGSNPVMLDVDGRVRVRAAEVPATTEAYSPVVRNDATGELKVIPPDSPTKPFNIYSYTLVDMNEDWVSNFNTKVDADRWSMAVIGYRFVNNQDGTGDGFIISKRRTADNGMQDGNYYLNNPELYDVQASANVYAYKSNGTWRLKADFAGAGTDDRGNNKTFFGNGRWDIQVLVIDNNFVNVLPTQPPVDFNNSSTASATSAAL